MVQSFARAFSARNRPAGLPPVHIAAGMAVLAVAAAFNFANQLASFHQQGKFSDFQEFYVGAKLGLQHGWAVVYDRHVFVPALVHAGGLSDSFVATLLQLWAVVPFTIFPLAFAFVLWWLLLVALFVLAWRLVVEGSFRYRIAMLLAAFGTDPSWFLLVIGQIFPFLFASLAATYWALVRRHEILAGAFLVGMLFKPQDALLVPLALLVIGRFRTVAIFVFIAAGFGALSFVLIGGVDGIAHWRDSVNFDLAKPFVRQYSLPEHLPTLLVWPSRVVIVAAVVVAAWRHREDGPAVPIAAAVIGSILVSPYLNLEDLQVLVLCAWLTLPTSTRLGKFGLAAAYAIALTESTFRPIPMFAVEGLWLSSLATGWTVRLEEWIGARVQTLSYRAPAPAEQFSA
jgi:hypothetical protein